MRTSNAVMAQKFLEATVAYREKFGEFYPAHATMGYPGKTLGENIDIINKAVATDTPVSIDDYFDEKPGATY